MSLSAIGCNREKAYIQKYTLYFWFEFYNKKQWVLQLRLAEGKKTSICFKLCTQVIFSTVET